MSLRKSFDKLIWKLKNNRCFCKINFTLSVPSQAPSGFTVVASTSTSITASWQLPPENARHGIITGFKLFYRKKDSVGSPLKLIITGGGNHIKDVTGLAKFTEYEFQVLASTSVGDGPQSSVVVERTKEDGKNLLADILITNSTPLIAVECKKMVLYFSAQKSEDVNVLVHSECIYGLCIGFAQSRFFTFQILKWSRCTCSVYGILRDAKLG